MSLQIRRGTAAELANITPVVGELIYTTDTQAVFVGDGVTGGGIPIAVGGSGNVSGTNVLATGLVSAIGNIVGNNFIASGFVSAAGNITGTYILGNGALLTGITSSYGNANVVANLAALSSNPVSTTGNVTAGNFATSGILSVTGNTTLGNLAITGSRTINVGNNRITNVATPSAGTDAATKDYVDGITSSGFTVEDDTANTTVIAGGDTLQLYGTANQITVAITNTDQVTFSLPSAVSVSGNITGGNLRTAGLASATGNVTGGNIITAGLITATGNITGGNLRTTGLMSATGNITGGNLSGTNIVGTLTTASQTNITSVGTLTSLNSGAISSSGNVTAANLLTGGLISATGNVTGGNLSGTNITGTLTTAAQTNITSLGTLSSLSVSGNVSGGNLLTVGQISATGNVTGNYFIGNGSLLTGITVGAGSAITNGTSNVTVGLNGNVTVSVAGTSNVAVYAATGEYIAGVISATGNITGGNVSGTNISGTMSTAAQPNITSLGTLTSLSVSGNVTGGNLLTSGLISSTGNITAGNLSVGTGAVSVGSIINNNANGVGNIGTTGTRFNTVFAVATSALYADLAEYYLADQSYPAGTIVAFGGDQEVTMCTQDHDVTVAGIVSVRPAYEMNAGLKGDHPVAIALAGRVPCQVQGPVRRGQMLVAAGDGRARAEHAPRMGAVIGKALQDFTGDIGTIEVVVGRL